MLTVILSSEDFGGDVIGGTAESARCIAWPQALLQNQKDHQLQDPLEGGKQTLCTCFYPKCIVGCNSHLAHAVVCEFDVSLRVQQHVVQLQISVDDSSLMKVVERQTDLCRVESIREMY